VAYVFSSSSSNPAGASAFQNTSYALNPGQSATFPWLSQCAADFEQYEIDGMIVVYRPTSGNATGANTALGEVAMATNYNAAAVAFPNMQSLLNSEFAVTGPPSQANMHLIECDKNQSPYTELYVRTGGPPSSEDLKTYDFGLLQVATSGCQTLGQQLGELWITYDIVFFKPLLGGIDSGLDIPTDKFQLTGVTGSTPLGTSQLQTVARGQIGGSINGATGTVYTFPQSYSSGTYLIVFACQGTAAALTAPTMTVNNSYALLQVWSTNVGSDLKTIAGAPTTGVSSGTFVHCQIISFVTNPTLPVTVTYGTAGTLPTAPTFGDLVITRVNSSLVSILTQETDLMKRLSYLEQLVGVGREKLIVPRYSEYSSSSY